MRTAPLRVRAMRKRKDDTERERFSVEMRGLSSSSSSSRAVCLHIKGTKEGSGTLSTHRDEVRAEHRRHGLEADDAQPRARGHAVGEVARRRPAEPPTTDRPPPLAVRV